MNRLSIPAICECGYSTMDAKRAYDHAMMHLKVCPVCGLSLATAREMLLEPRGSESRDTIEMIIANCARCRDMIRQEVEKN